VLRPSVYERRKVATLLFCDLTGSTALGERVDPETLRGLMAAYFQEMRSIVERHGGTVEKFIGDAVLAAFGVPRAHEDDALRACRAALEMQSRLADLNEELERRFGERISLRIGVNTGEVVAGDASSRETFVTGDPVNVAARLEQLAAPGEVLMGEQTYLLVSHAVDATRLEPLQLKGKRDEVAAFRLEAVETEATAFPRRQDLALIGRARELEQLLELYAQVARGEGARQVTLVGEAGIGKSRLARALFAEVANEATVLVGRCPPYGEGVTFWPLRELLAQAGRDEERLTGPTHEVFASVRRLLEELAGERPVVTAFDDVHWAEPTFLDFVEYLAGRLDSSPVLLLCLARPQLIDQRPAWFQAPAAVVSLEPLSETESELLLDVLAVPVAVRARVAAAAEGNPLFAEQLAAIAGENDGAEAIPDSIRGVLHERLDRLDLEQRALLERAAVTGRSFTLEAVVDLTPPEEQEGVQARLLALTRQRFVRPDTAVPEEGFRFHHALIREATYEGILKKTRAELHEQVAARLEAKNEEDALVGYHLEQAFMLRRDLGRADRELAARAGRLLAAAGREAFARSDAAATISLLERALALIGRDDPARTASLMDLGRAQVAAGETARALVVLDEAAETARRLGDRAGELHAVIYRQFARSLSGIGPPEESVRLALEVIPELERLGDDLVLARAWWLKSDGDHVACRWRACEEALEQALVYMRRAKAADAEGRLLGSLAVTLSSGPTAVPDAIARTEDLLTAAGPDRAIRGAILESRSGLFAMRGAFEDARRLSAEAAETWETLGLLRYRADHSYLAGQIEVLAGDLEAAERELRAGYEALRAIGVRSHVAEMAAKLADVLCTLGRLDEAEALAREAADSATADHLETQVAWRRALGRVLAGQGELEDAHQLVREALELTEAVEYPDLRADALTAVAEVELARGQSVEAQRLLEEARQVMQAKGNVVRLRSIEAALAELGAVAASDVGG
jgi:class 3 adenylate cyclase/predicted ATPase